MTVLSRDYTKKDAEHLEHLIRCVQADPKHMTLLQISSKQLELFIIEGQPGIHSLLASLATPPEEVAVIKGVAGAKIRANVIAGAVRSYGGGLP